MSDTLILLVGGLCFGLTLLGIFLTGVEFKRLERIRAARKR